MLLIGFTGRWQDDPGPKAQQEIRNTLDSHGGSAQERCRLGQDGKQEDRQGRSGKRRRPRLGDDRARREQLAFANAYFSEVIFPVLTPLAFEPGRPFPHISNLSLNLAGAVIAPVESRKGARSEPTGEPTRFPSPLIKPDVPVSSIRLSDRLHQLAHGSGPQMHIAEP